MNTPQEIPTFLQIEELDNSVHNRLVLYRQSFLKENSMVELGRDMAQRTIDEFGQEPLDRLYWGIYRCTWAY